ncbi:MAG: hypothetical protein JSV86_04930 [Gemmatimonadota bacterium]|nr:MAG: hypothetical protein JSV86_04930 [Gemmatimonadota bacterium]
MAADEQTLDMDEQIDENDEQSYQDDVGDDGALADDEADWDDDSSDSLSEIGEGRDGPGGADSLESEPRGAVPSGDLPPGFRSWDEVNQFRQQQQALDYYHRQQEYLRAQQAQSQQQEQQGFNWGLPNGLTPEYLMTLKAQRAAGQLTPQQQAQLEQADAYVNQNWSRWTYQPTQMVDDLFMPAVERKFGAQLQQIWNAIAEQRAAEFRRQNKDVLGPTENVQRYVSIAQEIEQNKHQAALKILRLEQALKEAQSEKQASTTKNRDRQASKQSAKGKPPHKSNTKGRRGRQRRKLDKKQRTNPAAVSNMVIQQMIEAGELDASELE